MRQLAIATLAAATAFASAPAFAQTVEELTVTGRALKDASQSMSRPVSFADLDLTRKADRMMLRQRVHSTAGDICTSLNEPSPTPANLGKSCQEIATRDALAEVRVAVAAARGAAYAEAAFTSDWTTPDAETYAAQASSTESSAESAPAAYTTTTVTNGPVADTAENRARYGAPMSNAGKRTAPRGN